MWRGVECCLSWRYIKFENGIAKLQAGEELDLTRSEKDAVRIYLRSDSECNSTDDDEAEVGYAEKFLQ